MSTQPPTSPQAAVDKPSLIKPPPHQPETLTLAQEQTRITHRLARLTLGAFLMTFMLARILVIIIMAGKLPPQLFFHVSGTHVHHLNYGIFLLSGVGAYLVFTRPAGRKLSVASVIYGIGLGLTFDEFGMWLHLGGLYWQPSSYDAIIVVTAVLAFIAFGSTIRHWRPRHHITIAVLVVLLVVFCYVLYKSKTWAGHHLQPRLEQLEQNGPT